MDAKQTQQQEVNRLLGEPITLTIGGHRYKVKEPTLGVLDLMSREWLKLPDIEFKDDMSNIEALAIAKKAIAEHSHTVARSIAIGLIGEGCFRPFGRLRVWRTARKVWRQLTHTECREATERLSGTAGLMDFIISMKLMSAHTTTTPKNGIE
jgi:hypothetical protein